MGKRHRRQNSADADFDATLDETIARVWSAVGCIATLIKNDKKLASMDGAQSLLAMTLVMVLGHKSMKPMISDDEILELVRGAIEAVNERFPTFPGNVRWLQ